MDSKYHIKFKLKNYSLSNLHSLHEFLDGIDYKSCRSSCKEELEQLSWILDKNNKYVKGLRQKRIEFEKLIISVTEDLDYSGTRLYKNIKTNPIEQLKRVIDSPFKDLPLLINEIEHQIPKAFLLWRISINK